MLKVVIQKDSLLRTYLTNTIKIDFLNDLSFPTFYFYVIFRLKNIMFKKSTVNCTLVCLAKRVCVRVHPFLQCSGASRELIGAEL